MPQNLSGSGPQNLSGSGPRNLSGSVEGASFSDRVRIAWEHHLRLGTGGAGNLSDAGDVSGGGGVLSGAGIQGGAGGGSSGTGGVSGTGDAGGAGVGGSQPDEGVGGDGRMFVVEGGTSVAVWLPDLQLT